MNTLQNLHTHTTYCDGKDTPEQIINIAIKKGFGSIGFSSHTFTPFSVEYTMPIEETDNYKKEINILKKKYSDKIDIFLGLEADPYSEVDITGYDYLIGAFHCIKIGDELVGFDRSAEVVSSIINTYFGGNGLEFAKEYYRQLASLPDFGNYDIIGHFDTITKNIEKVHLFDVNSKEYLNAAFTAIDALQGKIPFFEVNTGAIARGYRTTPYPMVNLLKELKNKGFGAIISSDCHNAEYLDCAFDDARELLLQCGFKEKYILTNSGFAAVKI